MQSLPCTLWGQCDSGHWSPKCSVLSIRTLECQGKHGTWLGLCDLPFQNMKTTYFMNWYFLVSLLKTSHFSLSVSNNGFLEPIGPTLRTAEDQVSDTHPHEALYYLVLKIFFVWKIEWQTGRDTQRYRSGKHLFMLCIAIMARAGPGQGPNYLGHLLPQSLPSCIIRNLDQRKSTWDLDQCPNRRCQWDRFNPSCY